MSILVKHLRDGVNRPFGTMVAINANTIGVALHCKPGFNKQDGVVIAQGRAEKNPGLDNIHCPNVMVLSRDTQDFVDVSDVVVQEYNSMLVRAEKYFK